MTSTKILLTGATGFLGGTVLSQLLQHPDASSFDITAFLRSAEKAEKLKTLGIKTIVGSFVDDRNAFIEAVSVADVVITVATPDDLPVANAVLEGTKKYYQRTGKAPAVIHTSGMAFLTDDPNLSATEQIPWSDLDVKRLNAIPETALHRNVDLALINADKEGFVKTYIVTPPSIVGYPNAGPVKNLGIQNTHSFHIPLMTRAAIQRKQGAYFGTGANNWAASDVNETAQIFVLILNAVRSNAPDVGHGEEGYYFAESFEYSGHEAAKAISEVLHEHGAAPTPEPSAFTDEEAQRNFGPWVNLLSTNLRARADRARALGWKPVYGTQEFLVHVKEEVEHYLAEAQKTTFDTRYSRLAREESS